MRRFATCAFLAVLLLGVGMQQVQAQQVQAKVGPRIGVDRLGLRQFLSADVHIPVSGYKLPIVINPTIGYYFSTDVDLDIFDDIIESDFGNVDSIYNFGINGLINTTDWRSGEGDNSFFDVHIGTGLMFSYVSYSVMVYDTEIIPSVNLIANAKFSGDSFVSPFLQVRTTIDSNIPSPATSFFALSFGILVGP